MRAARSRSLPAQKVVEHFAQLHGAVGFGTALVQTTTPYSVVHGSNLFVAALVDCDPGRSVAASIVLAGSPHRQV